MIRAYVETGSGEALHHCRRVKSAELPAPVIVLKFIGELIPVNVYVEEIQTAEVVGIFVVSGVFVFFICNLGFLVDG